MEFDDLPFDQLYERACSAVGCTPSPKLVDAFKACDDPRKALASLIAGTGNATADDGDGALDFNEFKSTVLATACTPSEELLPLYEEALAKTKEHRERAVKMEAAPRIGSTILSANSRQALYLPVAVDPTAFAEVVARKTCLSPPDFKLPSNSSHSEHDSLIDDRRLGSCRTGFPFCDYGCMWGS